LWFSKGGGNLDRDSDQTIPALRPVSLLHLRTFCAIQEYSGLTEPRA